MISKEFRDIRLRLKLTQEALGKALGVTKRTIAHWEAGAPIHPCAVILMRLFAATLGRD